MTESERPNSTSHGTPQAAALDRRQLISVGAGLALTAAGYARPGLAMGAPDLLAGIDTIVFLMMENRSFDHVLSALKRDSRYPSGALIRGASGHEVLPDIDGSPVSPYRLTTRTHSDPPHSWDAAHAQWNQGKNDGFVTVHGGERRREVLGYLDRELQPFTYWLADNFTVLDHWFSGVLGPTWPNRAVVHSGTADGLTFNRPYLWAPTTIWDHLPRLGVTAKNYYGGNAPFYSGAYLTKLLQGLNPTVGIDQFYVDAARGELPSVCVVDPDFETNDDHPSHDVMLGQALIASIYRALAGSPQWGRSLMILTYDEHGGFWDHVPPPPCLDDHSDFRQLGFRVPAIAIGPTVRAGGVIHDVFEHASFAATLSRRFGMPNLTARTAAARDLSYALDPALTMFPRQPPRDAPLVTLSKSRLAGFAEAPRVHSQPELSALIEQGKLPRDGFDERPVDDRLRSWLEAAEGVGAIDWEG